MIKVFVSSSKVEQITATNFVSLFSNMVKLYMTLIYHNDTGKYNSKAQYGTNVRGT